MLVIRRRRNSCFKHEVWMMKSSKYNFFVHYEQDNAYIGYNGVSGGLYVFNPQQYQEAISILSGEKSDNYSSNVRHTLLNGRFIIPDDTNEINILKLRNNFSRFNSIDISLVIAPTLACNFDCPYCYVDREKSIMSGDTVEALKKFFVSKLDKATKADIVWTGGEPLLAVNIIEELNLFFEKKAKDKSVPFSSRLISNGFLLKPPMLDRMKKANIKWFQITLDGSRDFHNSLRYTKGKGQTFDTILENVVYATNNDFFVVLRSNITKENYSGVYQLIDDLVDSGVNLSNCLFVPCMVTKSNEANRSCTCDVFSNQEFSAIESEIISYSLKRGFRFVDSTLKATRVFCGANTLQLHVIDSHANILKCWCNLGNSEKNKVGMIDNNGNYHITNHNTLSNWMAADPFSNEACLNCKVLPLCLGGCIYYQVMDQMESFENGCSHLKYNIENILRLLYSNKIKSIKQENKNQEAQNG